MVPLHTGKLSTLLIVCVTDQTGFERNLGGNPADGFLVSRPKCYFAIVISIFTTRLNDNVCCSDKKIALLNPCMLMN